MILSNDKYLSYVICGGLLHFWVEISAQILQPLQYLFTFYRSFIADS